jgi:hypothetical protein
VHLRTMLTKKLLERALDSLGQQLHGTAVGVDTICSES